MDQSYQLQDFNHIFPFFPDKLVLHNKTITEIKFALTLCVSTATEWGAEWGRSYSAALL